MLTISGLFGSGKSLMPAISVFVGQGEDAGGMHYYRSTQEIKSGFWIDAKDTFNAFGEVINYKNEQQEFYLKLEYEYLPMPSRPDEYYDVGSGAINVTPCESSNLGK
jgi:hypothetical protein